MLLFLPTPGNVALSGLALVAAGPDVPRIAQFRATLRRTGASRCAACC